MRQFLTMLSSLHLSFYLGRYFFALGAGFKRYDPWNCVKYPHESPGAYCICYCLVLVWWFSSQTLVSLHLGGLSDCVAAAAAKSLQSCPTLCDPIDGSPSSSAVPGILQARTLEWAAISFSNAWKWKVKLMLLSRVWLFATPWTAAHQAPRSMGLSRQEYWSGLPLPSPSDCIKGLFKSFILFSDHLLVFLLEAS